MKDNLTDKIQLVEQRTRDWMDKKYDILGIPKDKEIRDELFDIDMAIFMNQYLFRTFKFDDLKEQLGDAFDKVNLEKYMGDEDGR